MTEWTSGLNGNERSEQRGGGVSGPHLSLVVWALIANTVLPESSPRFHSLSQSPPAPGDSQDSLRHVGPVRVGKWQALI